MGETTDRTANIPAGSVVADLECEHLELALPDGYRAKARLFEAKNADYAAVYLHGIQSHGGWFLRSCRHLCDNGVTVLLADRRGSGLNTGDRGHCDSADQLIEDMDRSVDWLREKTRLDKISLVAVSFSGKAALVYAGRFSQKVRSVVLVAPGICPKVNISLRQKISIGVTGLLDQHKLHPIPLDEPELFTANLPMQEFIANDPLALHEATASFFLASRKLDSLAREAIGKVRAPVYLLLAENDRIIDNDATIRLLEPILSPVYSDGGASGAAKIYASAAHTLDFEPDTKAFFDDLAKLLGS